MGRLDPGQLSLAEAEAAVLAPSRGALVSFVGVARDTSVHHDEARRVVALEFEAYAPMALAELAQIEAEAASRWPGVGTWVAHRIGRLGIGEAAVIVAAAAPHRAEAFEACRYLIEELKKRLPIFKREHYEDGSSWVGNRA